MANEAVIQYETELPIPFTVADGTGVLLGSIMKMTDFMTAAITAGNNDVIAGILGEEKIADNGMVKAPIYRRGIFRLFCSGNVTTGDALSSAAGDTVNQVATADVAIKSGAIIGHALEDATDGHSLNVAVDIGCGGSQIS